ncbi:MAG TPA: glycine betaine ABC transporter substrate-binding protein [Emcibacteraceae bacterium]|nr:glycine betaine ABC transporter substrate-binding protein [Emcibacteraceae bacterium]HRW29269.1 glycine betaine ABC transporter substrate-binding protein [Emcibacteraceae bacterium]
MIAFFLAIHSSALAAENKIVIGSKMDSESYLLAEMMAQLLENNGFEIERKFGLGGTLICYNALVAGEIDLYPEYTGTITAVILTPEERHQINGTLDSIKPLLNRKGLNMFSPFGFNNSYVLTMKKSLSDKLTIKKISDLKSHSDLVVSVSHEFLNRDDGWPGLKAGYGLDLSATGIQHGLAYKAIDEGSIDITDAYSTDGDIERYNLIFLQDDRDFFPKYNGAAFSRNDFPDKAVAAISRLENVLDDEGMRTLNAKVVIDQQTFARVSHDFLQDRGFLNLNQSTGQDSIASRLFRNTVTHIKLTLIALAIGCFTGLLLAVIIFRSQIISRYVIYFSGLLQTIPSIALLALMIPILGIGEIPAITALFLYSLLPILRSAVTALSTIDPVLTNVSKAIGMNKYQQLRYVLFPLALPNILAGIKTAAVICIGTATLAAFIGAGGLGEPIVTGLALNDTSLILQGAIPAAILAIIVELMFEGLEKRIIPSHMRKAH